MGLAGRLTPFILVAAVCGLGFGLTWAFTSVSTQAVVPPEKAGEASGVVLTIVVAMGGVAIAIASSIIESAGRGSGDLESALQSVLVGVGVLALATSAVMVLLGRRSERTAATAPTG
jgi:hypothetical protein